VNVSQRKEKTVSHEDSNNVISVVEQIGTKPTKDVGSRKIFHQPPTAGITQRQTEEDVRYVGMVFTVPVEDVPKVRDSCDRQVNRIFSNGVPDQAGYVPVPRGIIERYEAYDINRSMVYMMYRVPCMPIPQKAG
jgi:hypothetical protein